LAVPLPAFLPGAAADAFALAFFGFVLLMKAFAAACWPDWQDMLGLQSILYTPNTEEMLSF
jgi:hypothetical protein